MELHTIYLDSYWRLSPEELIKEIRKGAKEAKEILKKRVKDPKVYKIYAEPSIIYGYYDETDPIINFTAERE